MNSSRTPGDGQPERQCTRCLAWLSLDAFGKAKKGPDGLNWNCRECVRERRRQQIAADPQANRNSAKRYAQKHPERVKARKREYQRKNSSRLSANKKQWAIANPEKHAEHKRREYDKNRQRYLDNAREWRENNPERFKERWQAAKERFKLEHPERWHAQRLEAARNYKARKRGAVGTFTCDEFRTLCEATGNQCLCCSELGNYLTLHADHVVPVSRGGANDIANIQPLCGACNLRKSAKTIDYRPPSISEGVAM